MDVTQALKNAENALRDFIAAILQPKLGEDWIEKCGVTTARLEQWRDRQAKDAKKQPTGTPEERILYYADIYDLPTILVKHWNHFTPAFGEQKKFLSLLDQMTNLRDVDAHRRELLPHQEHLILGISGEIRTLIVRYRSKMETPRDCFPRIESIRDNYGHCWVPAVPIDLVKGFQTGLILHPGDLLEFTIAATDPEGLPLKYAIIDHGQDLMWQDNNQFSYEITESMIVERYGVALYIKSPRTYHAAFFCDDEVWFHYSVLPRPK